MAQVADEKPADRLARRQDHDGVDLLVDDLEQDPLSGQRKDDVEAQKPDFKDGRLRVSTTAAEYLVATRTKLLYLAGYFALNLALTIYNKAVLGGVSLSATRILPPSYPHTPD